MEVLDRTLSHGRETAAGHSGHLGTPRFVRTNALQNINLQLPVGVEGDARGTALVPHLLMRQLGGRYRGTTRNGLAGMALRKARRSSTADAEGFARDATEIF